ncbi:uncharacterized protein TRIADDRAFT_18938 [Trichoplax adhaerens]|uniref:SH3 domain-containing YSC84-like protein 1 n=1 Tax=Trichoplax adhaerens TaxID=10228 RepID=B3RKJ1_TRIAD|nr:hypothetical protein TRIADDRAFT_18938 [Trichoplax adhaerens]EDV29412.1 hypothetical protein TRIADDRAFT_18938 [Trichoplax adhaerens]|eukprot:XP_002108614.1 hypothetical protein TRIADDRAFT_18938 [Trichoplax adhaerens]
MVNNPIPKGLRSEAKKASRILMDFTQCDPKSKYIDKIIPPGIIVKAKGLAILTVFKGGFLVTARGGSGLVIARTPEGTWSAPSALGLAGLGGGFEIGVELTDFVIVLNSQAAVDAFSRNGNVTLGGNISVAAGPVGRNVEGDVTVKSISAIYTYSKTRGLFAGISLEGSALIERKDTNRRFYGGEISAREILSGEIPQPGEAQRLYDALEIHAENYIAYRDAKLQLTPGGMPLLPAPPLWMPSSQSASNYPMDQDWNNDLIVTTLYPFQGEKPCDLSFDVGERITVITRTADQDDWWEGKLNGKVGIFPANYVKFD